MNTKLILAGISILVLAGCGTTGTREGIPLTGYAAGQTSMGLDFATVEDQSVGYSYDEDSDAITFTFSDNNLNGTLVIDRSTFTVLANTVVDANGDEVGGDVLFGHALKFAAIGALEFDDGRLVALHAGAKPDNINNLSGSAAYSGVVYGIANGVMFDDDTPGIFLMDADFTSASFNGTITMGADKLEFSGANDSIKSNGTYTGEFADYDGNISGAFYGANAAETAGTFHASDNLDGYLGVYLGEKQ